MSIEAVHYLNVFLGLGTIILQVLSVSALALLVSGSKNFYLDFIKKYFLPIGFALALFSSLFPLVYSEIIGFLPCALCWWQRVFMFPVMFLFLVALWRKDFGVKFYAFPLLGAGFLVSAYQNFFYYFGESSNLPCDVSGVSCYQKLVSEFGGYISIPMMALSAFFALLALLAVAHFYKKGE
ncbi:MAG: disulfide bond formation protein B [Candidatus Paceibacterota bacterium]|jgi:disulfide bond formation protein DsbB